MTIKEHDVVVLTASLPQEGLEIGDVGTVIHLYGDGKAYEVEFITLGGRTIAVATVDAGKVRPVSKSDMSHVRTLQTV